MIINLNREAKVKITPRGLVKMLNYVSRTGIEIKHNYINDGEYVAICVIQIHSIQEILGYNYRHEYNMNIEVI